MLPSTCPLSYPEGSYPRRLQWRDVVQILIREFHLAEDVEEVLTGVALMQEVAEDGGVTPHRRADIITDQMSTGHHHAHLRNRRWEGLDLPGVEEAGIAAAPETLSLLGRGPGHPCPDDGAATT